MAKIADRVRALAPAERRRFLQLLSITLAAPWVPAAVRYAASELAFGEAHAQQMETATLFLEINLRDQIDFMHVMVPPSLARHPNPKVGVNGGELVLFAPPSELNEYPNNVFLTNDSLELAPHVDSVAMLETGEDAIGGVHGHEACNGMRSPGRVIGGGVSGQSPLWLNDGEHGAANEELYGSVPTPASFHNYYQHQLTPQLPNGFAFKGISRASRSVYHYGAGLPGAELDRLKSKQALFELHGGPPPTPEQTALVGDILAQVAPVYRKQSGDGRDALAASFEALTPSRISLELTAEEIARWSAGVPNQQCALGEAVPRDCSVEPQQAISDGFVKAQIWEQVAYASKLFRARRVRSIALEFDHMDLMGDGVRTESVLRTQAQQVARPLARLIADLKEAGLYERTVIAVYTLDGSRQPGAGSYGDSARNSILLAGGRIQGGYYGDVLITGDAPTYGHTYAFRAPDPTSGALQPAVSNWADRSKRTPSGSIWRTVVKALGIPEAEYVGRFNSDVDDAVPLDFMLNI